MSYKYETLTKLDQHVNSKFQLVTFQLVLHALIDTSSLETTTYVQSVL